MSKVGVGNVFMMLGIGLHRNPRERIYPGILELSTRQALMRLRRRVATLL